MVEEATMTAREIQNHVRQSCRILLVLFFFVSCADLGNDPIEEWILSTPEAQGMNSDTLSNLTRRIEAGIYGEVHSLLVVRHGCLVFERYFRGNNAETIHPVYSVTKSVTALLVGIASDKGSLGSVNQRLLTFFPEYTSFENLDSNKSAISLRHVLTMQAGFDWNEGAAPYGDPRNPTSQLANSADWIKFVLDRRASFAPGTRFTYNSGCSVLLSGILRNRVGMQAEEFAAANLFRPLGIVGYRWERGAQQISNTGWGLSLRPRGMAKLGQLCLQNGKWENVSIVSGQWVIESMTHRVSVTAPYSYGYQWWLMPLENVAGHSPQADDIKIAWGWGDQFIFVIPYLDMVVVSTGGNYSGPIQDKAIEFVRMSIVKAVRN